MPLALGIDTGGTYTDVALVDYESGAILAAAKALTTRHNLMLGICQAIDQLSFDSAAIGLVSLSTTLATNALVEGQGAPVGAILIGYQGRVAPDADLPTLMNTPYVACINGGHDGAGMALEPLDHQALRDRVRALQPKVAAFAVSSYFGTRNPEHELAARNAIRRLTDRPVTCGHELSTHLDALRRATTVALNASLIPLICELLDAVDDALAARGISAPLMVVKGDGSLISADLARERPVETILSGPAASVVGAIALGGATNTIVVDMGGTTTDVAIIRDGLPQLSEQGATVGQWQTMVEAIEIYTCGLGGDSQITRAKDGALQIGPERMVPLAILACQHSVIIEELKRQLRRKRQPGDGEFLLLQRPNWREMPDAPSFHKALYLALQRGPVSHEQLRGIVSHPGLHRRYLEQLVREGWVARAGLTPTDCAHVLGWYQEWDTAAAELGARLAARDWNCDHTELCQRALAKTVQFGAEHAIKAVLASEGRSNNGHSASAELIARALDGTEDSLLQVTMRLNRPITAIGAPAPTYWPRSARLLSTPFLVPEQAGYANAVGAVAGSVVARIKAQVVPSEDSAVIVAFTPSGRQEFASVEEAIRQAVEQCTAEAHRQALAAGASHVRTSIERHDHSAPIGPEAQEETWLFTELVVTGAGRPSVPAKAAKSL